MAMDLMQIEVDGKKSGFIDMPHGVRTFYHQYPTVTMY